MQLLITINPGVEVDPALLRRQILETFVTTLKTDPDYAWLDEETTKIVRDAFNQFPDETIKQIKYIRQETNMGLHEAKDLVDRVKGNASIVRLDQVATIKLVGSSDKV